MARAINPKTPFEFVSKADRELPAGSPDRTVWTLRHLTIAEQTEAQDMAASVTGEGADAAINVKTGTLVLHALRIGVLSVVNFRDENGNDVPMKRVRRGGAEFTADDSLERIDPDLRAELCNAITERSKPDEGTAGKSSAPST